MAHHSCQVSAVISHQTKPFFVTTSACNKTVFCRPNISPCKVSLASDTINILTVGLIYLLNWSKFNTVLQLCFCDQLNQN